MSAPAPDFAAITKDWGHLSRWLGKIPCDDGLGLEDAIKALQAKYKYEERG